MRLLSRHVGVLFELVSEVPNCVRLALGCRRSRKPVEWISDPIGYVFLPRAMLQIGQALFSDEWTGAEPATPVFLPLPVRSAAAPEWQKREAHVALCKERPDFGRKPLDALPHHPHISLGGFSKGPPIIPPFTDAEWEAARAIYIRNHSNR
jgi:hypothetical protein